MIKQKKSKLHLKVSVERKFFLLVGHLVHFSLYFPLHINELLKLHSIIFCMLETTIKGVAMQTDESRYIAFFVVSGSVKKLFSIDCVNVYFSQSISDFRVSTAIMLSRRHFQ